MKIGLICIGATVLVTLAVTACGRQPARAANWQQPARGASASAAAVPSKWIEGHNYSALSPAQPTSVAPGKVEVLEMFWYGSDRCFRIDPVLENWRNNGKPAYVEFERVPVMTNSATRAHARLYYTLEALGKLEPLHAAVFHEIHVNNGYFLDFNPETAERLQRTFLKANGVSDEDFDRAYHSTSVESRLQRAEQLTRLYKATDVPLMVVDGKYTADLDTAGGGKQLLELVNDLATSERSR